MGLLEALCVIYIRTAFPADKYFLPPANYVRMEEIRELCTVIMLVSAGWLAGINARTRLACFFFAFGAWDILYYYGLWEIGGWEASVLDWDLLFLLPKAWYGPILAPVLVSIYFMLACCYVHLQEYRQRPVFLSFRNLAVQLAAGAVWYWSFLKDSDQITTHGYAGVSYSWPLFALGTAIGVAGLAFGSEPRARALPTRAGGAKPRHLERVI
jgi:hypothetical protein